MRIEGHGWEASMRSNCQVLSSEGETIETKLGTCVVTGVDPMPDSQQFAGTIRCRVP